MGIYCRNWYQRALVLILGALLTQAAAAQSKGEITLPDQGMVALVRIGDFPLPGRSTRFDYMSFDPRRSRLYIAHLGDSSIEVFDTNLNLAVGRVADVRDVHGTLVVPELGRVYATATGSDEVVVIDAQSLKTLARIRTGRYPDGLAYASDVHKLYVSDKLGKTVTVIDVRTNQRVASIPLGGEVGNTRYDPLSKRIYVNVQGTGELVEIDPLSDKIARRGRIAGANRNHGLLIEPDYALAFIANEGNNTLQVVDLDDMSLISTFQVGQGPDVLAYDAALGTLYVASESGMVTVFRVGEEGVFKVGGDTVGDNAHTVAVEPATHKLYLPIAAPGKPPVLRVIKPVPLP